MYGYFSINVHKNPNPKLINSWDLNYYVREMYDDLLNNHKLDKILYDYMDKPSNPHFKSFLDMLLKYINNNDTLVVQSIFQLGKTKVDIYKSLSRMRAKQVKLIVDKCKIDISSTMKKVLELSVDDLVIYENLHFYKNIDDFEKKNIYRELAGYKLNKEYIKNETEKLSRR